MKQKKIKIFTNPILKENPVLVALLGMCPFLGSPTSTINNALGIGVAVILVLLCTNTFISLIRKWVPNEVRIPVFIVIIACFVTMVEYLMKAFTPDLASSLGIFIPMITVNCIILGRAEAFASKNSPLDSALDGVGTGIGFTIVCLALAFFREVFATGGITFKNPFNNNLIFSFLPFESIKMPIFGETAGAFLLFGIMLGIYFAIMQTKQEKAKAKAKDAKAVAETTKEVKEITFKSTTQKIVYGITSIALYAVGVPHFVVGNKKEGVKQIIKFVVACITCIFIVGYVLLILWNIKGLIQGIKTLVSLKSKEEAKVEVKEVE